MDYPIVIVPLSEEDGGGFLGYVPDLKGCMSDGETPEEAATNTQNAIEEWIDAAKARKLTIPAPNSALERERNHQANLVQEIKRLAESFDQIDGRLEALEKLALELEERRDHADAWSRFAELTGVAPPGIARDQKLLPS